MSIRMVNINLKHQYRTFRRALILKTYKGPMFGVYIQIYYIVLNKRVKGTGIVKI